MVDRAQAYKGYRIYPRGFLGASLGEQVRPTERSFAANIRSHTYHPEWFKNAPVSREINQNVEAIWRHLNSGAHAMDNMDFREKVLRIALGAFGTDNFYEWISMQLAGPSTGDLHIDFLKDMCRFIDSGQHGMSLHNWTAMLSMSDVKHNETPNEGQFNWFFITGDKRPRNMSVIDVVQRWCSHPGGFHHLTQSLHVLFGELSTSV